MGLSRSCRRLTSTKLSPTSTDGELATELSCAVEGCTSLRPINDAVQTALVLTVRRTDRELTAGPHSTGFQLRFDDGTVQPFSVQQFANPEPSNTIADVVATSSGPPQRVQTVFGHGWFVYHAISAFDSIWILDRSGGTVMRIDAVCGSVVATIDVGSRGSRLAASADAVYVAAQPAVRIDPSTNEATAITGGDQANGIIADTTIVWTASLQGPIQRVDPDGTITTLDLPKANWMDLAISNGLIWAIGQAPNDSRLIAFDGATGQLRYDIPIPDENHGFAVRIVADAASVVSAPTRAEAEDEPASWSSSTRAPAPSPELSNCPHAPTGSS